MTVSVQRGVICRIMQVDVKKESSKSAKLQPMFSLTSMCAAQLLLEFVSDEHPSMLFCWAAHASDLDKLAEAALAATGKYTHPTSLYMQQTSAYVWLELSLHNVHCSR